MRKSKLPQLPAHAECSRQRAILKRSQEAATGTASQRSRQVSISETG